MSRKNTDTIFVFPQSACAFSPAAIPILRSQEPIKHEMENQVMQSQCSQADVMEFASAAVS
jgi:hypothetical protein